MAAIDEVSLTGVTTKTAFAAALWDWLDDHRFDEVFSFGFLFIKKSWKWQDLFPAIEKLLGTPPQRF
jgi:hypothetical protein